MNKKMRITASVNKIVLTRNIWDIISGIYLALLGSFICWLSFLGNLENDEDNLSIILLSCWTRTNSLLPFIWNSFYIFGTFSAFSASTKSTSLRVFRQKEPDFWNQVIKLDKIATRLWRYRSTRLCHDR